MDLFHSIGGFCPEIDFKGKTVLDIGCGTGNGLLAAAYLGADKAVGVDIDLGDYGDSHLDTLAANYKIDIFNLEFIEDNIEDPKLLGDRKFDIIFSYDVWEHISRPREALLTASKLLAPGGIILISVAPMYFSPIGSHLWNFYPREEFPWAHLILPDEEIKSRKNVEDWTWSHYVTLNRLTVTEFESHWKEAGLYPVWKDYQHLPRTRKLAMFEKKILPEKTQGIRQEDLYIERMIVLLKKENDVKEPTQKSNYKVSRAKQMVQHKLAALQKRLMILPDGYLPMDPILFNDVQYIDMVFRLLLSRKANEEDLAYYQNLLETDKISRKDIPQLLFESKEYERSRFNILEYIHKARLEMIQTLLPAGDVIVDLGGASPSWQEGCLYGMGYPHQASKLIIVDLPPAIRMLKATEQARVVTDYGKCNRIEYHYSSMSKLEFIPDSSVEMVWSGESIEHISENEGEQCLQEVWRILKPGGHFCLDTPNRLITRLESPHRLIHPEHKIEYTPSQLKEKLQKHGFEIMEEKGLLPLPESQASGQFAPEEIVKQPYFSDQIESCYLFYIKARKPE